MIVYHGSNSCFRSLKINKSLIKSSATVLNEGMGIYFSLNKDVASSYGKYLYTLEVNDKYVKDFRVASVCKKYVNEIRKVIYEKEKIDIISYLDIRELSKYIFDGKIAVSGICREIYLILDSNDNWYRLDESKINRIYKILSRYDKDNLNIYLFNYNIKNIGVIKNVDPNLVRIIKREK